MTTPNAPPAQPMNFAVVVGLIETVPGMMYNQTSAGAGVNPVPTDRLWGAARTLILVIATINIGAREIAIPWRQKVVGRSTKWPSGWTSKPSTSTTVRFTR